MLSTVSFAIVVFAVLAGQAAAQNYTVAFENAHYRGHYLAYVSATAAGVRNPPVSNSQKWRVDWGRIFQATGSSITSLFTTTTPATAISTTAENAVVALGTTPVMMRMSYRVVGSSRLYKLDMFGATAGTIVGCILDNGVAPVIASSANCAESNLKAWWYVYTA